MTAAKAAEVPTIQQALAAVMRQVGAVRKEERNAQQGFNFRGIDAVVKAVYPALVEHGVIVTPQVIDYTYEGIEIGAKRTPMGHSRVRVAYTFTGPAGDSIQTVVVAESMDSGDKATAKAMSVALRTALLQTLMLPTDEPDPDASSYERATPPTTEEVHTRLARAATALDTDIDSLTAKYRREHGDITVDAFLALDTATVYAFVQQVEGYINRSKTK